MASAVFSMTGFGAAAADGDGVHASVEIRSVNQRGQKISVRSRPSLGPFEKNLRDLVGERFRRGAVDVFVNVTRVFDPTHPPVREDVARGAVAALRHLAKELDLPGDVAARDLISVPGLFEFGGETLLAETEWPTVETALKAALAQADGMRETEGAATVKRLRELVLPIAEFAKKARTLAPGVVTRAREKLQARIAELCPNGLPPGTDAAVEREICFFADRADINEELDRLGSHLNQFEKMLTGGGEIGKRIDFLAQEFLREVNTSASKASDAAIVSLAVEAKLAAEKIKEQAANLE